MALLTVAVAAAVVVVVALYRRTAIEAECLVTPPPGSGSAEFVFTPEQTTNAATIAAVGIRLGVPAHATTIALATALQESKLHNLDGGDRDSIGLFQQRPSQGWGTPEQLHDPIYAATAFFRALMKLPDWTTMAVTEAAQAVQRSGAPAAYARWEPQARATAAAFNGQFPAALTCHHMTVGPPSADLVTMARAELGFTQLSGPQEEDRGWTICAWLIAHAPELGVDRVSFAGRVWTSKSGSWSEDPGVGADLSLHQVPPSTTARQ